MCLSDGATIAADVVVVGIGVTPNTEWLASSGLAIDDGVVCDSFLAASAPGVVAAGDVARWWHPVFEESVRVEHWTNEVEQAEAAARRLLSGEQGAAALGPMAVGIVFLLAPLVIGSGLLLAWRGDAERSEVRVLVVAALVGLFYAHHAAVRSDASHLAQAIPPVLLAALALPIALQTDWRK